MKTNDLDALNKKVSQSKFFQDIIIQERKRLFYILQKYIILYYKSYNPKVYKRTYRFIASLRVDDIKQANGGLSTRVYFDESKVTRNGGRDYLPERLNYGYNDGTGKRYHYDSYEGFNFMEKAQEEYNKVNPYGLKVVINRS